MKPIWKHIIACIFALAIIAYMVFGLWMSRHTVAVPVCKQCHVRIQDGDERQYVNYNEIIHLIQSCGLYPVGKSCNQVRLQPIEDVVGAHDMVRTAECYKNLNGDITIAISQREPVVRVLTPVETYFIDTDRKRMPVRQSVTTPVLIATGEVSQRMAQNELSEFALWLKKNKYWGQYIHSVKVVNPKMVYLKQTNGRAEIILGDWQRYEKKLKKLRHWYEADTLIHQEQYRQVDLRFNNQVIGIKN